MNKKNILFAISLLTSMAASAYDFQDGAFYYNILSLSDLTVQVTCSDVEDEFDNHTATYSGDITIPKTVEYSGRTFTVSSINSYAFINCHIGTLTIPENVKTISAKEYGGNNQRIGSMLGTFKKLVIEDSDVPIECDDGLVSGQVTESVYLGRNISDSNAAIVDHREGGEYAEITFGNKVTTLGSVCEGCKNLTSVVLPKSIKSLTYSSFGGCTSLETIKGEGVELIDRSFWNCSSLTTIDMPNLKVIEGYAFANCTSLKSMKLPQGLIMLGNSDLDCVFENCSNLESITLPATLQSIGSNSYYASSSLFKGCSALKNIIVSNPVPVAIAETNFDATTYINATLRVPIGSLEAYKNADGWKNFFNIVEDANITDDIFTITIDKEMYEGSISVEYEEAIPEYQSYKFVRKGSTVKITVTPERYYKLSALYVNGVDVMADVVDNTYTTTVQGSMLISAKFVWSDTPEPEEDIYLSIKQADNGNVKLKAGKWNSYQFVFAPAEGWVIHSVSFNGKDVTNEIASDNSYWTPEITENSELVVVYASSESGIEEVESSSPAKIFGYSGNITVNNAKIGDVISVYTTAGVLVNSTVANSDTTTIRVQENEVYIVKVGKKTFKIGM